MAVARPSSPPTANVGSHDRRPWVLAAIASAISSADAAAVSAATVVPRVQRTALTASSHVAVRRDPGRKSSASTDPAQTAPITANALTSSPA